MVVPGSEHCERSCEEKIGKKMRTGIAKIKEICENRNM
jgi:hypothetical protein